MAVPNPRSEPASRPRLTLVETRADDRLGSRFLVAVALLCLALLGLGLLASAALDRPLSDFTREPQNALRGHFYVGFVAVGAILIWASAAAIALFTALIATAERREFLVLGLAMSFLVLDDAFQVHEVVLTNEAGISQPIVYGVYLAAFLALLVVGRRFLARHDTRVFAAAITLLAASVSVDLVEHFTGSHSRLLEEATKLLGIALLVAFTCSAAAARLRGQATTGSPAARTSRRSPSSSAISGSQPRS